MTATLNTIRAVMNDAKMREQAGLIENEVKLMVVKRDDTRVPYDRSRILAGIQRVFR